MIVDVETRTASDTERIAAKLARCVRPPLVILLDGDLGAGKTTFARGFVSALPDAKNVIVQSPTFALARTYPTSPRVHHVDLYRLESAGHAADIESLGLLDMLSEGDAFSLVEWPRDVDAQLGALAIARVRIRDASRGRALHIDIPDAAVVDAGALAKLNAARASAKKRTPTRAPAPAKRASTKRKAKSKRTRRPSKG